MMRGFHYDRPDLQLHLLFQEMQGMSVDRAAYVRLFGTDVVEEHRVVWAAFEELGWVSISADTVAICGDGVFYLPLIQNALAHDRNEQIRKRHTRDTVSVPATPPPALVASPAVG